MATIRVYAVHGINPNRCHTPRGPAPLDLAEGDRRDLRQAIHRRPGQAAVGDFEALPRGAGRVGGDLATFPLAGVFLGSCNDSPEIRHAS
jgi:hypothetical protein